MEETERKKCEELASRLKAEQRTSMTRGGIMTGTVVPEVLCVVKYIC